MKQPLKKIGIIMIILGGLILLTAFPLVQQSVINFGSIKVTEVPPISATRILIGFIMILLGLVVYFGKEGLKIIVRMKE